MADLSSETKTEVIQETTTNEANAIVTRANEAKIDEDMVGDQLRGLVDPSGIPLYGCVGYQEEALLTAVTGAAEALSDVDSRVFEGSNLEVGTVTGVDMVDNQLRGSVDPSGTPLHGCVEYQEGALLAAATGAVEDWPGAAASVCSGQVHHDHNPWLGFRRRLKNQRQARKRRGKIQWLMAQEAKYGNMAALSNETKEDVIQETTTNEANVIVTRANEAKIDEVRMDQTGINEAMSGGTAVIEVELGEIKMEGGYARAANVDIIREKEVNMHKVVVDEVMANTDVDIIMAADSGAEIVDPVEPESPCTLRWKWGDPRFPMKRGHFEHDPIEVMDNNKPMKLRRGIVSNFSNISAKNAAVLPPPSKRSGSCGIRHTSMTALDGHGERQDGCNPDDRATPPPYPCESGVVQADLRAAEEGKQSGAQQLDNETKNSIADGLDEDNDGGYVLQDLLECYNSDSAEPSDDGNLGETERVLLALETATPLATFASTVATHNCGVDMRLNQEMLVETMRPGGPLQSCGKIILVDRLVHLLCKSRDAGHQRSGLRESRVESVLAFYT